jgi:cytochrome c oxidase cbb3-type subunit 2
MPRYTWLFIVKPKTNPSDVVIPVPTGFGPTRGTIVATRNAQDLVAYLESLKQVPLKTKAGK